MREVLDKRVYSLVRPPSGGTQSPPEPLDERYVIDRDGIIELNREAAEEDGKLFPAGCTIEVKQPNEELYREAFQYRDPRKQEFIDAIRVPLQSYDLTDAKLLEFVRSKMKSEFRTHVTRGDNAGEERQEPEDQIWIDIRNNTAAPDQGFNAKFDLDESVKASLAAFHGSPVATVAPENRPTKEDALNVIARTIAHSDFRMSSDGSDDEAKCREGVDKLARMDFKEYVLDSGDVGKNLIIENDGKNVYGNHLSDDDIESIMNARRITAANAYVNFKGVAMAVAQGNCILVKNKGRRDGDVLVRIAGKDSDPAVSREQCVGSLIKKGWTPERFQREGPYIDFEYSGGTYFMSLYRCELYKLFNRDEVEALKKLGYDHFMRRNVIDLGNGYFIAQCTPQEPEPDDDGLTVFNYHIMGVGKVTAHQLVAMAKRGIGTDSRGWIMLTYLRKAGYTCEDRDERGNVIRRGQTPEEAWPLLRIRSRVGGRPGFPISMQSEVSDIEHAHGRENLHDNNCMVTHDTSHSRNTKYTTYCSNEQHGSGYTNFAHTTIVYTPNSRGSTRDHETLDAYRWAHSHGEHQHGFSSDEDTDESVDEEQSDNDGLESDSGDVEEEDGGGDL